MVFVMVMVVVLAFLHALHRHVLLHLVPQGFHQVQGHLFGVDSLLQGILHPVVRGAADVEEDIGAGHPDDVLHRGLEVVQVDAGILEQVQGHGLCPLPQHLPGPVIDGEGGGHHLKGFGFGCDGRAGNKAQQQQQGHANGGFPVHDISPLTGSFWDLGQDEGAKGSQFDSFTFK